MKNLLKRSAIALVMLIVSLISCKKDPVVPSPVVTVAPIEAPVTWTPKGSEKPIVTKADIKNGDVNVPYSIEPKVANPCVNGTWEVKLEAPAGSQYALVYSAKTGKASFTPLTKGTYKLTFIYKCPGSPDISITVTITAS